MYSVCCFSFSNTELSQAFDGQQSIIIINGFMGCILINVVHFHTASTHTVDAHKHKSGECKVGCVYANATHSAFEMFHISWFCKVTFAFLAVFPHARTFSSCFSICRMKAVA